MKVYKSQFRSINGNPVDIASTTEEHSGYYVLKPGETVSIDLRAKALNRLRSRLNEDVSHEPTYRAGYIKGVAFLFEHEEPINVDRNEPVIVLTYKEGKLSARANWGRIQVKGEKSGALVLEAIEKLIRKIGRNPEDYKPIMRKFRGTHYVLLKDWN